MKMPRERKCVQNSSAHNETVGSSFYDDLIQIKRSGTGPYVYDIGGNRLSQFLKDSESINVDTATVRALESPSRHSLNH